MSAEATSESVPTVSVIVPCYNHGAYLDETVNSVLAQTCQDFEIIVVNDGSTDPATVELLESYNRPRTSVIHTANQGLPAARNTGIAAARGKYIVPLDSDDLIGPSFLEKAVGVLDSNPNVGIVASEAEWFGSESGPINLPPYSFPLVLVRCMFVCTAAFRRADWEIAGGYKTNLKYGHEDWDFWLSLVELGRETFRIPEVLFYYRRRPGSMLQSMTAEQKIYARVQMFRNHPKLYSENIEALFAQLEDVSSQLVRTQKQMSDFVQAASEGREVIFSGSNGPIAKLVPIQTPGEMALCRR